MDNKFKKGQTVYIPFCDSIGKIIEEPVNMFQKSYLVEFQDKGSVWNADIAEWHICEIENSDEHNEKLDQMALRNGG